MPSEDGRPNPDALLAAIAAEETPRGHLKVFLGAAPGVGKTWEMLGQARQRRAQGEDVLAGVIETHGRAETQAQIGDLPELPRKRILYRNRELEEFDLDAALARRPGVLLVDELAHTNVPGSRHAKRWEDVAELVQAGITVWATLNVQHLESLNDDIARITGIRPAETLPDRVLEMADEIEVIDLPPADLRQRMREGKIYRSDDARRALDGFFREGNLAALREIALRRAAAHVASDVRHWMLRSGVPGPWPTADRVLALVGPDAAAESVVRQAKRLADALRAPWAALHVEHAGAGTGSALTARVPLSLAAQLGAEIEVRAGGNDLVAAVIDAARVRNATNLVLGRGPTTLWRRLTGRTLGAQLLKRAPDFALHIVPAPGSGPPPRRPPSVAQHPRNWLPWAGSSLLVAAVTVAGVGLRETVPTQPADIVYLGVVVAVAAAWGTGPALLAAALGVLAWDFFFIEPLYRVTIDSPRDIVTGTVFAAVALLTGALAGRVRAEARAAGARIEGLRRIVAFSRRLGEPTTEPDLLTEIGRQAAGLASVAVVLMPEGDDIAVRAIEPPVTSGAQMLDEGAWAAARWTWTHGDRTGRGTSTLPSVGWRFLPMSTVRGRLGVLGVRPEADLDEPQLQALEALADQAAVALERVRLSMESARTEAMEETQHLRTALLASLGHDLRTPLAGIQGAAGTLRTAWDGLASGTRADLLSSIEEDVGRMARFLASITELTRLESGEVRPRVAVVPVAGVLEAAMARLPGAPFIAAHVPEALRAEADEALLEQALFNVLDNAVKYAPDGSLVRVSATSEEGQVCISVADEGVGIPADDLPHVFDSFFRVRRGDRAAPGTGLGLAIARGLVEAMGGRIEAHSPRPDAPREGMPGTVVTICVPEAPQ
jgi:two-component system, OmpR family, sensor histidine kinase KdpD